MLVKSQTNSSTASSSMIGTKKPQKNEFLEKALIYTQADISIIPTKIIEKSPLVTSWKKYQSEIANNELVTSWFTSNSKGIGVVLGPVSNNMEVLDFDNHFNNAEVIFNEFCGIVKEKLPDLFSKLVIQSTQSKGYHVLYRCEEIENNQKLARQKNNHGNVKTVIETRGQGGYALAYPTKGYKLIQNTIENVSFISIDERSFLISLCKSFNQIEVKQEIEFAEIDKSTKRPGDEFNERGNIEEVLISYGWQLLSQINEKQYWCRPDKKNGVSATWNFNNNGKFHVFSSNADPFDVDKSYDKFTVYTLLAHNGDYRASAKDLVSKGYGTDTKNNKIGKGESEKNERDYLKIFKEVIAESKFNHNKVIPRSVIFRILEKLFEWEYNEVTLDCKAKPINKNWEMLKLNDEDYYYWRKSVFTNKWHVVDERLGLAIDDFITQFYSECNEKENTCKNESASLFYRPDENRSIHPIKDYFNNLPKYDFNTNLENPISEFLNLLKIDDECCSNKTKLLELLTKYFIMVIQCIMGDRPNDVMLILVGGQHTGKTTAIRALFPDELKDYIKDNFSDDSKDTKIASAQNLFFFDDEGTSLERSNIKFLKGMLSQRTVKLRRPYGTKDEIFNRIASFVGTNNNDEFLKDETGSRRYLVIPVTAIDNQELIDIVLEKWENFDKERFWSYIMHLYSNRGANVEFTKADIEFTHNLNKGFSETDSFDDLIEEHFLSSEATNTNNGTHYSATKILEILSKKTELPIANKHYALVNLGKALQRLEFVKKSNNGKKGYWICEKFDEGK